MDRFHEEVVDFASAATLELACSINLELHVWLVLVTFHDLGSHNIDLDLFDPDLVNIPEVHVVGVDL